MIHVLRACQKETLTVMHGPNTSLTRSDGMKGLDKPRNSSATSPRAWLMSRLRQPGACVDWINCNSKSSNRFLFCYVHMLYTQPCTYNHIHKYKYIYINAEICSRHLQTRLLTWAPRARTEESERFRGAIRGVHLGSLCPMVRPDPDPPADPKTRSPLGVCNLHYKSIGIQYWGSAFWIPPWSVLN